MTRGQAPHTAARYASSAPDTCRVLADETRETGFMQTPTVLSRDPLTIYLNDHLLGATAGVELARRSASANAGSEFGAPLEQLAEEIDQDRDELIATIERLGCRVDRVKVAVGWMAEKLGRLKPNGQFTGYSPLARLLELEGLIAGIYAKRALWQVLKTSATESNQLKHTPLTALIERADTQLERVHGLHHEAARLVLG
jgi:hypothetical protein